MTNPAQRAEGPGHLEGPQGAAAPAAGGRRTAPTDTWIPHLPDKHPGLLCGPHPAKVDGRRPPSSPRARARETTCCRCPAVRAPAASPPRTAAPAAPSAARTEHPVPCACGSNDGPQTPAVGQLPFPTRSPLPACLGGGEYPRGELPRVQPGSGRPGPPTLTPTMTKSSLRYAWNVWSKPNACAATLPSMDLRGRGRSARHGRWEGPDRGVVIGGRGLPTWGGVGLGEGPARAWGRSAWARSWRRREDAGGQHAAGPEPELRDGGGRGWGGRGQRGARGAGSACGGAKGKAGAGRGGISLGGWPARTRARGGRGREGAGTGRGQRAAGPRAGAEGWRWRGVGVQEGSERGEETGQRRPWARRAPGTTPCPPSPQRRRCARFGPRRRAQGSPSPALGLSPLAEPAGGLRGAQTLEGFLRQESEVVAAQVPRLPGRHRPPR